MPTHVAESIREQLAEIPGIVFDGFSRATCDPITGDRTDRVVTWNGRSDLSPLRGRPVYLRFQLRNCGLCAFRISE